MVDKPCMTSSNEAECSRKSKFPDGMRVLVVDDDIVCLRLLQRQLTKCGYEATAVQHASTALQHLRENKDYYDIVITDVWMPDIDGFKLLEIIGLEMDLPVIMLSVNSETSIVMKGVIHGAVDYMSKPVRTEDLKLIWKHVIKKSIQNKKKNTGPNKMPLEKRSTDGDQTSKIDKRCKDESKEREESANHSDDDQPKHKKSRLIWSPDLHARFIEAVNQLGLEKAVPKRIHELMNIEGLTRENVASHLQKYRKALMKNGIGMVKQLKFNDGANGFHGIASSSNQLSSGQQAYAAIDSAGEFRASEFQENYSMTLLCQSQNFHENYTSVSSSSFSLPSIEQKKFHGHHFLSLDPQSGHLSIQNVRYPLNPLISERLNFHSRFDSLNYHVSEFDDYMHNYSQNFWNNNEDSGPVSVSQVHSPPNQYSRGIFTENNDSEYNPFIDRSTDQLELLLPIQHEQSSFIAHSEVELDRRDQISADQYDQPNYDEKSFEHLSNSQFANQQLEHNLPTEMILPFNNYESSDDLNTFIQQFQQ